MTAKMDRFPTTNSNPMLSVAKDGTVLYSNKAAEHLLHKWGVKIGEKLPQNIEIFVQRAISRNNPEKMEVKVGKKIYLVVLHPLPEQESVNVSGFDISNKKELEEKLPESETQEEVNLELAEIIDIQAIQSLMDDFYRLAHIPMGLIDLKGNVLAGVGWQDICTQFHRVNPETCKHCVESDTKLSTGVFPGESKLYKCKNNMWDVVTPVMVNGKHVANIFSGQFFFEDEQLNYELFRSHARKYGFNEEEYIAALEKVPRLSKEAVNKKMSFFMKLANILSQLSHSNFKLSKALEERNTLVDALLESEEKYRNIVETANEGIWVVNAKDKTIYVNNKMAEILGYSQEEMIGKLVWDFIDPENKSVSIFSMEKKHQNIDDTHELKLVSKNGLPLWTLVNTKSFFDKNGKFAGFIGMLTDITKRKQEENRIRRYNRILEGINRIFSNVVQAKTEEELGETCLSVALEVTGSEFGFIIEMGADGLLHDVAKSKLAWEQCLMYDKTGHINLPRDYVVHGLYGSVIINEKSFFTNDPKLHPDSRGLPEGHPPIMSFLGVPFILDGKIIGSIAVANREGGYSYEQQEDLEAIEPTVTQALQRKRSEEALELSNLYNRSLIEASLDPLVTIGHDGKITDVNGATEQVTGYSRRKLIGTDFSDYFTEPERAHKGYQQVFTEGIVRDYPLEIQHKDGHITPVLYNASVYRDENGKVIGVFAAARDIAEIQKAEENIQTLANVVESSEDAIITKSLDGIITSWNKGAEQVYGYLAEEVLGKSVSILEPDNIKGETNHLIEKIKQGERVQHYESTRLKKDGTIINVSVTLSPIFDVTGKLVAISAIARDFTERRKTEEALRESEERFRALVMASSEMIYRVSPDWSEMRYFYGRGFLANTESPNPTWLHEYVFPEDQQRVTAIIKEAIRMKSTYQTEHRVRLADGSVGWIFSRAVPILDSNGEIVEWFGAASDITERKKVEEALRESEERLRLLGDNLPESAVYQYILEPDGSTHFQYLSAGIERLIGISVSDALCDIGMLYRQIQPEYLERLFEAEAYSARKLSDFDIELPLKLPNDQAHWIRLHSRPRRLPEGRIIWDGVLTDITEQKRAEKALKKARDTLEEKVKERTAELEKAYNSLKESEKGLAEAQKMAHIGNWDWDLVTGEIYWSEEMYRIYERDPEKPGAAYDELLYYIHPDIEIMLTIQGRKV